MEHSELRARRAAAQLLDAGGTRSAPEVVGRLLAVQAQELRSARLAVRARASGLTATAVDRELTEERSLVVGWLLRGTLHMVRREDYAWLHALTAPRQMAGSRRRLGEEGVSPAEAERAVELVATSLAAEGPLTRAALAERLASAGIPAEGQATPHLLRLAALEGLAVLGPVRDGVQAYALAREWLGEEIAAVDGDAALATLAARYLAGHAPATAEDLAAWAGLPLGQARAAFAEVEPDLPAAADPPPRLLPSFDPYLLGWKDRSFAVPPEHARRVHPGGGVLRATATVDGVAVGTWRLRGGRVEIDAFALLSPEHASALEAEAADVERFEAG
ncbi:MAG: winged helix DNA-binding domain-containing protein [Gaiellaceae bacterium]